ncbi:conserved Plasmodium protein, unknown function [Plasmodium vivax]|uniref:Uncharacterized protein n=1 Tax=Plasmodium vivax TaxID=5855 RepID=A0A564ZTY1_PLAVI|nr:conserved Plasmodium protein, unknown function [Plasmodium vivax]
MLGKFISETYNKVKSKADEVRLHVSVQAIKAKEVFGLVKPTTVEQLEVLLNYELQQIDTAEALIGTYKKWIYNLSQSEKSDCIRYYKSVNRGREKRESATSTARSFTNSNEEQKDNTFQVKRRSEHTLSNSNITSACNSDIVDAYDSYCNSEDEPAKGGADLEEQHQSIAGMVTQVKLNDIFDAEPRRHVMLGSQEGLPHETTIAEKNKSNADESKGNTDESKGNTDESKGNTAQETAHSTSKCEPSQNANKEQPASYIYDDHYGYNFKEFFLKSNILEKSISLILEKRDIRLSLVGPIEKDDLENPRTTILTLFSHCLIGNQKLHKDILFIILTTDKLFDNHKELFLELLAVLKYDYLDVYLMNIRKIVSAEVLSLKSKIQMYDSKLINVSKLSSMDILSPRTSVSSIDFDKEELHSQQYATRQTGKRDLEVSSPPFSFESLDGQPLYTQEHSGAAQLSDHPHPLGVTNTTNPANQKNEENTFDTEGAWENDPPKTELSKEISKELCKELGKELGKKLGKKLSNELSKELSKELHREDSPADEKEIIESNKMQQIKILASAKLIELHKMLQRILQVATENRQKRKVEIKVKLEELKKIMEVCKKDCEITLHDTEDSKVHIENVYVKELDLRTSSINQTQEQVNQMKRTIEELLKKKRDLYNEYNLICNEINIMNKQLSTVLSTLTAYKKELNQAEVEYLNKLSNTNKAKHMHQERKLYVSNLDNISDEILREYESSTYISTDELVSKTLKMKKPLNKVITNHLTYLKDKLCLLNALLKFYVHRVKFLLGQHPTEGGAAEGKATEGNTMGVMQSHSAKDTEGNTVGDVHNHSAKDMESNAMGGTHTHSEVYPERNPLGDEPNSLAPPNHQEQARKLKLIKYKKCYFKIIEQISKVWVAIQEFYDLNKENIDDAEGDCPADAVYQQINDLYNYSKRFIMQNGSLISSIS